MTCNAVLDEPFNSLAAWSTVSGSPSIAAGRTGTAAYLPSTGPGRIRYTIPAGVEWDTVTLGFALYIETLATTTSFLALRSDAGATEHIRLAMSATGIVTASRAGAFANASTLQLVAGSYQYVELQARVHDTLGSVNLRVNGTTFINVTGDFKNAGTKTTIDTIELSGIGSANGRYDDLYLRTGDTCSFLGDHTIGGASMKAWNGSAFVAAPVNVWNGSAFVGAVAVKTWNGSAFV